MSEHDGPADRAQRNLREHGTRRREQAAQRGPRGVASVWWDEARAVAARIERSGDSEAWNRLCRVLESFCDDPGTAAPAVGAGVTEGA